MERTEARTADDGIAWRPPSMLAAATLRRELSRSAAAQGVALAILTAVISGFAIFVNSYAVKEFSSPTVFTTLKNSFVGVALLALVLRPRPLAQMRHLTAGRALGLLLLGVIGGSVPFVLFFEGLSRVDGGNAAFLHKTLFLWVAALAVLFLRERLGRAQLAALALLLLAQVLLGGPGGLRGAGVAMVLAATLLWSFEVIVAKRLLSSLDTGVVASGRMTLGAVFLLIWLAVSGEIDAPAHLSAEQWAWVLGTGVVLLAYVRTWYGALQRAPATAVTCVLTLGAPITAALNALAGRGAPSAEQMLGYAVLVAAGLLFAALASRRPAETVPGLPAAVGGA